MPRPPPCPSPTGSNGRSSACSRPPAGCRSRPSSTGSPGCSSATTCRTRRSSGPASPRTAASPPRPTSSSPGTTCSRSQEHTELARAAGRHRPSPRLPGLDQRARTDPAARRPPLAAWLDDRERNAYLPLVSHGATEEVDEVDAIWYVRSRGAFLFEVEWTAMLGEPILRRHARIPPGEPRPVPRHRPGADRARPLQARALAAPAPGARGRQLARHQGQPPPDVGRPRGASSSPSSSRTSASIRSSSGPASRCRCSAARAARPATARSRGRASLAARAPGAPPYPCHRTPASATTRRPGTTRPAPRSRPDRGDRA